ncbi:MAG: low molecular weight phosphotyrosine protein phosphatase [Saprospiraceae bacterium]|nr:low molecular weight phosphotyrosine protein phosphatase [Saprospiraceae bacterium]
MNILMVCLGNICRSPLAEGILRDRILKNNLNWKVDSAGTGGWHTGELPDRRAVKVANSHGIDITDQRARQLSVDDFSKFDLILAMDSMNFRDILKMAPAAFDTSKLHLILDYITPGENACVPDPYYDGRFEFVYQLLSSACDKLISQLCYAKS